MLVRISGLIVTVTLAGQASAATLDTNVLRIPQVETKVLRIPQITTNVLRIPQLATNVLRIPQLDARSVSASQYA